MGLLDVFVADVPSEHYNMAASVDDAAYSKVGLASHTGPSVAPTRDSRNLWHVVVGVVLDYNLADR